MKINKIIARGIATFFGSGLSKKAPGTVGSAAGAVFFWLLSQFLIMPYIALVAVFLFTVGWWASCILVKELGEDPQIIVIDEVAGIFITLLFVPVTWINLLFGFAFFRFFDILKPWPVSWADKKIGGGLGVMADDILAGIYAAVCLLATAFFIG